jgi:diguanylate cyclase (GGDEF)-like protein
MSQIAMPPPAHWTLGSIVLSRSPQLRRLVLYWASTCSIYLLAVFLLWLLVLAGQTSAGVATALSCCLASGVGVFYLLVRMSHRLDLDPSVLTFLQGIFATGATVVGYAISGQFRGATLSILVVIMSYCSFALSVRQTVALSLFTLAALAATMVRLNHFDPARYLPLIELAHLVLAAGMLGAVVFLTAQWNRLRDRLKRQKLELAGALARIQLLATNDDLTSLPNRRHMNNVLRDEERRPDRASRNACIALIDIDHFKRINDVYGHAVGDEVLRTFALHLKQILREDDVLARWGGEEFLLLLPDTLEETVLRVLERAQSHLDTVQVCEQVSDLRITFSGGLTSLRPHEEIADAVRRADLAMFQAKSEGRNAVRIYASGEAEMRSGVVLERDLPHAISDNQLVLYYQPQVDAEKNVIGCEALVRWQHPVFGLLMPDSFIPLAEQSNLIFPLGQWVINEACRQIERWSHSPSTEHLTVSVNVSAREFRHVGFVDHVLEAIKTTGIDAEKLELEITESMLIKDLENVIKKMNQLRAHGVRFALDDFGTGYSSLSYLERLPLSRLKIDKSFTRDIFKEANGAVIAGTIVALARSLGLASVAEGVETVSQHKFLLQHGCDFCQGYLFSKPVLPADIEQMDTLLGAEQLLIAM